MILFLNCCLILEWLLIDEEEPEEFFFCDGVVDARFDWEEKAFSSFWFCDWKGEKSFWFVKIVFIFLFGEKLSLIQILFMSLIVVGIIGLKLMTK